jgi:CubicO group peptidase (beta-lactamase class C family)
MTRIVTETGRQDIGAGVTLVLQKVVGTYTNGKPYTYDQHDLQGLSDEAFDDLGKIAVILQNLPEGGALDMSADDLEDFLKDWARDLAEDAEVPFTFTSVGGKTNTYTPASMWEASGSCSEWEQSAQEGYDYGWNV